MKKFILIRHAKSSWSESSLKDIDRPLNDRGIRDAPLMAQKLFDLLGKVDRIVSSPANRAMSTALVFANAFNVKEEDVDIKEALYHAFPEEVMKVIHGLDNELESVIIFGHNPTFTTLVDSFSKDYIDNMPTCGIAIMESKVENWKEVDSSNTELVSFLFPKML